VDCTSSRKVKSAVQDKALAMTKIHFLKFAFAASAAFFLATAANAQGNADAAKGKVSMCIGCHEIGGYKASFPTVYSVPMIHGQSAKYLEAALQAYKKGERSHPTMRAIAGSLTDAEMANLAAYFAGGNQTSAKADAPKK
jgi:cytochrome c553